MDWLGEKALETTQPPSRRRIPWRRRPAWLLAWTLALFVTTVGPWWHGWLDQRITSDLCVRTERTLESAASGLPAAIAAGPLRAGVATIDLTALTAGMPLAGYGHRVWKPNSGIADPVSVRALVLHNGHRRLAVIAADLLIVTRGLADSVVAKLQAKDPAWLRQEVYFSATHTHSSLGGYADNVLQTFGLGWFRPTIADKIAERMADAICAADVALEPVELGAVSVQVAPELIRNRTLASDAANRWLDLLVLRRPDTTEPVAVVAVFGAHATCSSSHDLRVSAGYPGAFRRALESQLGGTCLFLAGAVGSMAPPNHVYPRERLANWLGEQLAAEATGALRGLVGFRRDVKLASLGLDVALPKPAVKLSRDWRLSPVLASRLFPDRAWVHVVRIGDRLLIGAPADYSGTLAEKLRPVVANTVSIVTSFAGDYVGYILPDDYYNLPKYEPRQMAFFGPHLGSYFQETLALVANRLCPGVDGRGDAEIVEEGRHGCVD